MAYSCPSTYCPRIPFFSAKGYSHSGVFIGDSEHDNARMISETAATVASWSSPPPTTEISTNWDWYYYEEEIVVSFEYSDPQDRDWVGIYSDTANPANEEPLLWLYTCNGQACYGSEEEGVLTFGYGSPSEDEAGSFPLPEGHYVAVLGRNPHKPYNILASTPAFEVFGSNSWVDIYTNSFLYDLGEDIEVVFDYDNPEKRDWVGIYHNDDDAVHKEPLLWFYTCGNQHCNYSVGYDTLTFGDEQPDESGVSTFPLLEGTYVAVLARNPKQPYNVLEYSDEFVVYD